VGRKLVGRSGVHVASSVLEIRQILDDILRMPNIIEDAMSRLLSAPDVQ
jgi:hypothetical protein